VPGSERYSEICFLVAHSRIINFMGEQKTLPKKALLTGITGQDGSFLAEFLLSK